jgi:hypothetical protein
MFSACCARLRVEARAAAEGKEEGCRQSIEGDKLMSGIVEPPDLAAAAATLVRRLGGAWRPGGAMCRCPAHEDRRPSLSVRVGTTSLLFKCFAGCTGAEVLRAVRRLDLAVPVSKFSGSRSTEPPATGFAGAARQLWDGSVPLSSSRGAAYLAARGLALQPPELRFHPHTPLGRGRLVRFRPAIIAAVREGRMLVAVQRLFLAFDRPVLATDLENPKLTLGRPGAGAVQLSRVRTTLGLAEGIETALSAATLLDIPVWAVLGNERLSRIEIPPEVERLVLLPDNDRPGRLAERLARKRYAGRVPCIRTIWPWDGHNDWNDVLRAGGKGAGNGVRRTS